MDRQKLDIWEPFLTNRRYQVAFGLYDQVAAAPFDGIDAVDLRHPIDALDRLLCS